MRHVDANTFKMRREPAPPTLLDEAAVLKRMRWTPDQLKSAQQRLGFPRDDRHRQVFHEERANSR